MRIKIRRPWWACNKKLGPKEKWAALRSDGQHGTHVKGKRWQTEPSFWPTPRAANTGRKAGPHLGPESRTPQRDTHSEYPVGASHFQAPNVGPKSGNRNKAKGKAATTVSIGNHVQARLPRRPCAKRLHSKQQPTNGAPAANEFQATVNEPRRCPRDGTGAAIDSQASGGDGRNPRAPHKHRPPATTAAAGTTEFPNGPRQPHRAPDGPGRPQTAPEGPGRPPTAPSGPRPPQTAPDGPRRRQTAPDSTRRTQTAPDRPGASGAAPAGRPQRGSRQTTPRRPQTAANVTVVASVSVLVIVTHTAPAPATAAAAVAVSAIALAPATRIAFVIASRTVPATCAANVFATAAASATVTYTAITTAHATFPLAPLTTFASATFTVTVVVTYTAFDPVTGTVAVTASASARAPVTVSALVTATRTASASGTATVTVTATAPCYCCIYYSCDFHAYCFCYY